MNCTSIPEYIFLLLYSTVSFSYFVAMDTISHELCATKYFSIDNNFEGQKLSKKTFVVLADFGINLVRKTL